MFEQVNIGTVSLGTRFYKFQPPTPTLSLQTFHLFSLEPQTSVPPGEYIQVILRTGVNRIQIYTSSTQLNSSLLKHGSRMAQRGTAW